MIKTQITAIIVTLVLFTSANGRGLYASKDKPEFASSKIPETLLKKAIAVVREDNFTLTIESKQKSIYKGHVVITILTPNADYLSYEQLSYDKFSAIKSFTGALYDKNGKLISKLKKSDISDGSAVSYGTLFSDNRYQHAGFECQDYPYTVEFEYEIEIIGSLHYPANTFQSSPDISVEKSTFSVITPIDFDIRIKECNLKNPVTKTEINNQTHYTWQENNLPVYVKEPYSPPHYEIKPLVFIAPSEFIMEGFNGNMETWKEFGLWLNKLNEGRQDLPEKTVSHIQNLTSKTDSPLEKIETIYKYLQSNTRYISIQVGIGGWQPFEAKTVDKHKYGDCKALVNYTKALLNVAGINSYYTLVKAGENAAPIMKDFPSNQFNHAILCVPIEQDTLWLECTSQSIPFGYLGDFTGDRDVLLITPEGGKLAHTTIYSGSNNKQTRSGEVKILPSGDAIAHVSTHYSGLQYETIHYVATRDIETQKKSLYKRIDIPSFKIEDFSFALDKKQIPEGEENVNLQLSKYATVSGKRIFFVPNIMNQNSYIPKKLDERNSDIIINMAYQDCDSIIFDIPAGYEVEYLPEDYSVENEFGSYRIKLNNVDNKIIYVRHQTMNKGRYSKDSYDKFREYLIDMVKQDKKKVILSKKEV